MEHKIIWQHMPDLFEGELETPSLSPEEVEKFEGLMIIDEPPMPQYAKGVITQQGIFPINENFNPYDFWIGHSSFIITENIEEIISNAPGIEYIKVLSPYRFKIAIGKVWVSNNQRAEVLKTIETLIFRFLEAVYTQNGV